MYKIAIVLWFLWGGLLGAIVGEASWETGTAGDYGGGAWVGGMIICSAVSGTTGSITQYAFTNELNHVSGAFAFVLAGMVGGFYQTIMLVICVLLLRFIVMPVSGLLFHGLVIQLIMILCGMVFMGLANSILGIMIALSGSPRK